MIRTLLVDDEPIVRKGLIHIMPWERYGFRIAADADSGEKALERLSRESFDLLVTDLTMPGMTGFQLIQETRKRYPELSIVILTCHQDFQYVQEALRMGALDYIVKTELEDEKLDVIFERISASLRDKSGSGKKGEGTVTPKGVLFLGLSEDCSRQELYAVPWIGSRIVHPVDHCDQAWYMDTEPDDLGDDAILAMAPMAAGKPRWIVVRLHQVVHRESLLSRFVKRHAFYVIGFAPGESVVHESLHDVLQQEEKRADKEWLVCWDKFDWIFDDRPWDRLLKRIEETRPDPDELAAELFNTIASWKGVRHFRALTGFREEALTLAVWQEWKAWLTRLRDALRIAMERRGAGEETAVRVLQAICFVRKRLDEGITQEDAAAAVHLSRGYFSDCFKRAAGCTFNDYMKELRFDRAVWLMATSGLDVADIAQKCGFADESYFRKLFRESTGQAPKEFRQKASPHSYTLSVIGLNEKERIVRPDSKTVRRKARG